MKRIRITEVGPRDGLQNERAIVPVAAKVAFIDALAAAGCREIEVTSFVPPKWVPQLADGAEVLRAITRMPGVTYSALVPNERGLDGALACGVDAVAVFAAASEGFSRRNTNGSIDEVFARIAPVIRAAKAAGVRVRGYLSCVIQCPFDGPIEPAAVAGCSARLLELGIDDLDLGDTTGAGTPDSIEAMYAAVASVVEPSATILHLHDTRGQALPCVERALTLGVKAFDSSATGLGGCPYAPGAPGNLATESLVRALHAAGWQAGIDADAVARAGAAVRASFDAGTATG
ncbi:MAG: hydroxymethylglutaryl-CoA lyase [Planctomycetes bacterium]|nr:hydroxymethylglutaryl-CoA lyase [Planctomycetota bacterium]